VTGNWKGFGDAFKHLILPSVALGTIPMAIIARLTRSNLLDVMGLDYIRTARAKGLGERLIVFRHAMRNAMLPLVTVIGLQFGGLLGGAVLTETVFSLPGMGRFLVDAIFARDYPVIQGFTLIIALVFVFMNLLVDISYAYLDPRVRLS
jgi:peptide/nickel transport system permease protein